MDFFCVVGSLPFGITDCGVLNFSATKSCSHPVCYIPQDPRACKDIENERFCNELVCGKVSSNKILQNYAKIQFLKIFFLTTCCIFFRFISAGCNL